MMPAKQKRAIVAATISGSLMRAYKKDERSKVHENLLIRIRKGVGKSIDKYGDEALDAIRAGEKVWNEAMDQFRMTFVEASYFVVALSIKDSDIMAKGYGMSHGIVSKWAKPSRRDDALELEKNTSTVCKFIFKRLNEEFGIDEENISVLERIKKTA